MKYYRSMLIIAIIVFVASTVMYVISFWTGETLGGEVYTSRWIMVFLMLLMLFPLLRKLDRGTIQRRLWSIITLAMLLAITATTLETIDAYAGRMVISQDIISLIYLVVFIPILVVIFMLYFGYKSMGFEFQPEAFYKLMPSFMVLALATVLVVMVPLAMSSGDLAVRISDIFSLAVQLLALFLTTFIAATVGAGPHGTALALPLAGPGHGSHPDHPHRTIAHGGHGADHGTGRPRSPPGISLPDYSGLLPERDHHPAALSARSVIASEAR